MSLLSAAERFAAMDRSSVAFDPKRCLHSSDRFAECDACFRICPVEAIHPGKPPALETEKCTHCLACLPVCPPGAFRAQEFLSALLNCITRCEGSAIELLCGHNPHTDRAVNPQATGLLVHDCLAGIGAGGYAALAALGLEEVTLRLDACPACPWGSLKSAIETQVEQARLLLAPWQKEGMIRTATEAGAPSANPILDVNNPPLTRRDLIRLAARQGQVAAARALDLQTVPGTKQPGHDRLRLLGALKHLHEPSSSCDPHLAGGNFALVSISEACTICGACARACPTSAINLDLKQEQQTFLLDFTPSLCIGCEMCIHVCEPGAVTVSHDPPFSAVFGSPAPVTLLQGFFARCETCKAVYPARDGTHLCPVCEYRLKNPFGSRLPSSFRKVTPQQGGERTK